MVDLFTNVKGSGFATPIPGGAGGGTPATAKVFNGNGYNAYDPTYIVGYPYSPNGSWRFISTSDLTNLDEEVRLSYSSGYPINAYPPSQAGHKPVVSKNGYIYTLGTSGNSLHVIDGTDVANITISSFIAEVANSEIIGCYTLQAHPTKDLLWCMSSSTNRIFTIDISNPANPTVIGGTALDPVDTSSYNRDFCLSYDGEYAFYRTHDTSALYNDKYLRIELDGLNAPTNVTDIGSSFSIPPKTSIYGFVNYIEDTNGIPHIITSDNTSDSIEIATLDSSYNMTGFVRLSDSTLYDDVRMITPLPYGYQFYPASTFSYVLWEDDATSMGFEVWDGTVASRIMDVQSAGDFIVDEPARIDSWNNYIMVSWYDGASGGIRVFQWNTVNALDFVDYHTNSYGAGATLHVE